MTKLWSSMVLLAVLVIPNPAAGQYPFVSPESATFDPIRNRYLVSDQGTGTIVEIDSMGIYSEFSSGLDIAKGLLVRNDTLFVAAGWHALVAYDLETPEIIMWVDIPGMVELNDVAADSSGNIYVSDAQGNSIHKVRLSDLSATTIVTDFTMANGLWYDAYNDRLLAIQWIEDSPISAIDCSDYTVTTVVNDGLDFLDGITRDIEGNYYISSFGTDAVYKYDSTFSSPPELFSSSHTDPGDIHFNKWRHEIIVPCVNGSRVDFIKFIQIDADTTYGHYPLEVQFTGSSRYTVDNWMWYFGDGDTASLQSPLHTYSSHGMYDVTLEIETGGETYSYTEKHCIIVLADTVKANDMRGDPGQSVKVEVYANNTISLNQLRIPIEYQGTLDLTLDSVSVTGCRTEHFDSLSFSAYPADKRAYVKLINDPAGSTPPLEAGSGTILNLYFTISASAIFGQSASVILNGFSTRYLLFFSPYVYFTPVDVAGTVSLSGICGDANNDAAVNILDVTYIINYLYKDGPELEIEEAGDADGSGIINILDVTHIINYLYKDGPEPIC
ncbi:MAG: SMP-30/gluconolactonase/LRE family protein [Candidatus Zixiibacteriota bacterium]|nr:MAG: SMP-30/gluconolactonase/LRE family protein [candidate division Zixibacteria bacterium]